MKVILYFQMRILDKMFIFLALNLLCQVNINKFFKLLKQKEKSISSSKSPFEIGKLRAAMSLKNNHLSHCIINIFSWMIKKHYEIKNTIIILILVDNCLQFDDIHDL